MRVAVAGWYGAGNLGDELILQSLAKDLRERGARPVALSVDPRRTEREHGVEAVAHRSPVQSAGLLHALRGVDALAVAGGIIQSETSPWNLPFHLSRLWAARAAKLPTAAVGLGVGRVSSAWARRLTVSSLASVSPLVVRDRDCERRLRDWRCAHVETGADPAFALRPGEVTAEDTMCVILRPPNRGGLKTYARKAPEAWRAGLERTAGAIAAAATATGLRPRLVAFEARFDDDLHAAVAQRLAADVETVSPSLGDVLSTVGRSRLVITMRYHGAIAALLHRRPAVLLDYSPKMSSLAAEGGGWATVLDPQQIDAEGLVAACSEALSLPGEAAATALATLRDRLTRNADALDALVAARP